MINVNNVSGNTAKPDLMSQLNQNVPSFNYNKQSGADGADAIDRLQEVFGLGMTRCAADLRGMSERLDPFLGGFRQQIGQCLQSLQRLALKHFEVE